MSAKDYITRIISGEDPSKVVQEITKGPIPGLPQPMGIVKKTRRKPAYESLIERAAAWLLERKRAPTVIMYHGTSSKFLREIKKKGLVPNPRMRVWADDPDADRYTSQVTRRSIDGVYFTSNFMTAVSAGGNAWRKFGGTYLFIAAQIQPRAAYADEDTVKIKFERALKEVFGYADDLSHHWFEGVALQRWQVWGIEVAEKLQQAMTRAALPFGLGKKGAKVPQDAKGCADAVRGWIEQAAVVRYAQDGEDWLRRNMWHTKSDYATHDATDEQKKQVIDALKKEMPTKASAERLYLKGMDSLTRRYKGLAMLGDDEPGKISSWFTHTLRIPEPVTYGGRNKILAIFQTLKVGKINYITVHYGKVTPKMIADMKRSSWLTGSEDKIITPAQAKKLGVDKGE